ncbi:transposase domain-containing protein [Cupriavidus basilensis]|uniref:transposase domain-containing protein n=1 Tax=Cupriavidus basilensis TaxID=68895 RepID=UPI00118642A2
MGTCRLNGIEPYARLKDTLERLPAHPISRLHELPPLPRQPVNCASWTFLTHCASPRAPTCTACI